MPAMIGWLTFVRFILSLSPSASRRAFWMRICISSGLLEAIVGSGGPAEVADVARVCGCFWTPILNPDGGQLRSENGLRRSDELIGEMQGTAAECSDSEACREVVEDRLQDAMKDGLLLAAGRAEAVDVRGSLDYWIELISINSGPP